jgi:hypothetical protein
MMAETSVEADRDFDVLIVGADSESSIVGLTVFESETVPVFDRIRPYSRQSSPSQRPVAPTRNVDLPKGEQHESFSGSATAAAAFALSVAISFTPVGKHLDRFAESFLHHEPRTI